MNATRAAELAGAIAERVENLRDEADSTAGGRAKRQIYELRRFMRRLEVELEPADDDTLGEAC